MRRKMKKYLYVLAAATVMLGGIQMPKAVNAQENRAQTGVTVTSSEEFMTALQDGKSPITVQKYITIGGEADEDGRMLPVEIPANTVIQSEGEWGLCFRSPIQLKGDGVCFQDIKLNFESSTSLGSVPHREIFLAGHELTLDNVNTYLEGASGSLGALGGSEEELLPTVYAGGYTGSDIGDNASLTVQNSNKETMFQAIYMGHREESDKKVPYTGSAVLNLDDKAVVRGDVDTSYNSRAEVNITGKANQFAKAKQFYGNMNTVLTVDTVAIEEAVIDTVGNIVVKNKACLSPKTENLFNVTLQNGACLDFKNVINAAVAGDFNGEMDSAKERGILVLNENGSLTIDGNVAGITQFQTNNRFVPGTVIANKQYIYADAEKGEESNFVLAQKNIDNGYGLQYSNGVWTVWKPEVDIRKIGRIEILSAPSKVDVREIMQTEEEADIERNPYFEIKWDDEDGNAFSDEEAAAEENMFYGSEYVVVIRTDYWEDESAGILDRTDWEQYVNLVTLEGNPGRYYLQSSGGAEAGDYTFLFCDTPLEDYCYTVADVKALKDTVKREQRVIFYNQDTEEQGHNHTYISKVTRPATCMEEGLMTYSCSIEGCTDTYTAKIKKTDHKFENEVTQPATCTETGLMTYRCVCGMNYTEEIKALGHTEVIDPAVEPTETTAGKTEGSHCSVCGKKLKVQEEIPATGNPDTPGEPEHTHEYQSTVTKEATCTQKGIKTYTCSCGDEYTEELALLSHKYVEKRIRATVKVNGKVQQVCRVCSNTKNVSVIYKPQKLTLSKTDFTYDGKVKTPSATIKDSKGKKLKTGTDYQVKYPKGRKSPGVYTVTIEFRGNYSGKMTGSFTIRPKKTSLKKVTAKSKGMQVTWQKQTAQMDGYQIQYCASKSFKGKTAKITTAKKNTTTKQISKLSGKKQYYVRIRTYKTVKVNGKSKKLYSNWSSSKSVRTKK